MTVGERRDLCADEPFATEPVTGTCTGFLVGEDLILTAGHCTSSGACWPHPFAFGLDEASARQGVVPANEVYYCADVVDSYVYGDQDWALVRLDRPVSGRTPLPLSRGERVSAGTRVAAIGHPVSLPLKVSLAGTVHEVGSESFTSDLDLYGGSSGSPIIAMGSGEVVGVLFAGPADFEYDREDECSRSTRCAAIGEGPGAWCRGAESMHIDFALPALEAEPSPPEPDCEWRCADYGYRLDECREGWECTGVCIERTECGADCLYPCAAWGYTATTCNEGWSCVEGCVEHTGCGS